MAFVGSVSAVVLWVSSKRTRIHMGGGFEGNGTDLSVLWTELPLVALAGAVLPALVWALGSHLLRRRRAARDAREPGTDGWDAA